MPLPTLDDFKTHLNISSANDDAELSDVLAAAVDVVEGIVGPLRQKTVTETHYGVSSPLLVLRRPPASAVTDLTMRAFSGSDAQSVLSVDVLLDPELGVLRLPGGYRFRGDVTVTYTAGFDTVPQAVWLAVLIIAAHLWETQRGTSPSALALQGADDFTVNAGAGYAIPNRATELLASYARGAQIA